MRYGYKANYSEPVRKILENPEKSRALVKAIEEIRKDPSHSPRTVNGGVIRTEAQVASPPRFG